MRLSSEPCAISGDASGALPARPPHSPRRAPGATSSSESARERTPSAHSGATACASRTCCERGSPSSSDVRLEPARLADGGAAALLPAEPSSRQLPVVEGAGSATPPSWRDRPRPEEPEEEPEVEPREGSSEVAALAGEVGGPERVRVGEGPGGGAQPLACAGQRAWSGA
jgi:hypothetical protein